LGFDLSSHKCWSSEVLEFPCVEDVNVRICSQSGLTYKNIQNPVIMPIVKKFEKLECWKEARILVQLIYGLTKKQNFKKDFGLRDQI
jgi:hypothetical protein